MNRTTNAPITPKQLDVLRAAAEFHDSHCYSATIAELAEAVGVSRPTVHEHLVALRENGLVRQLPARARSLRLTERGKRLLAQVPPPETNTPTELDNDATAASLPMLGVVSAGYGIEPFEDKQPFSLPDLFGNIGGLFVLRVQGRSMIEAGIRDGDYVICHRQSNAENGQLVVALLDEERATLKRFYKEPSQVCLMPANDAFEPIFSRQCRIEAVVLGLVRRL